MQLMSQFEKVHLFVLMRSVEYSLEGVLVGEVPPIEQADETQATLTLWAEKSDLAGVGGCREGGGEQLMQPVDSLGRE